MATYFFHIRDGNSHVADEEGLCLSNIWAARVESRKSLIDLTAAAAREHRCPTALNIEIADEVGNIIEVIEARMLLH